MAEDQNTANDAAGGKVELETGDEDFDDLFWVVATDRIEAQAYLDEGRRTVVMENLADEFLSPLKGMEADIRVEGGQLVGYVLMDFVTVGAALDRPNLQTRFEKFLKFREELKNPPKGQRRSRQKGWVNQKIRDKAGERMMLAGVVHVAVLACGLVAVGIPRLEDSSTWSVVTAFLGALSLMAAGASIKAGRSFLMLLDLGLAATVVLMLEGEKAMWGAAATVPLIFVSLFFLLILVCLPTWHRYAARIRLPR